MTLGVAVRLRYRWWAAFQQGKPWQVIQVNSAEVSRGPIHKFAVIFKKPRRIEGLQAVASTQHIVVRDLWDLLQERRVTIATHWVVKIPQLFQ